MIKIKTEYKGYEVEWQDFIRCFQISKDGIDLKAVNTLEEAEKWIKQRDRKKWKRIDVFYRSQAWGNRPFMEGSATSIIDGQYAWVTRSDKTREKINLKNIFVADEGNKAKIATIKKLTHELNTLQREINDIHDSMETITPEMMEL